MSTLLEQAKAVMQHAYAPYSQFKVGCAIRSSQGTIHASCNVENAVYGLSNCAEINAINKMVSQGEQEIVDIVIIGSSATPCLPCGICRQHLAEFASPKLIIHCYAADAKQVNTFTLGELLPHSFNRQLLDS